jgi:hypothetical protein
MVMYRWPLILLALCLIFFCISKADALKDEDLVLYLKFDEGKGVDAKDSSDNGNSGVINGDVKWIDGKFGKALEFAGDVTQFVEVPDSESLRFGKEPFTYMAWIKTYQLEIAQYQLIMSKRVPVAGDGMETASLFIMQNADFLFVEFRDNVMGMFAVEATDAVLTENTWHHVAWVKDDAELRFYIDGELKQTAEHDRDGTVNGTQPLYIGVHRYGNTWNSPFIGAIDSVAIFRAALNESDIKSRMNNALSVEHPGKLAFKWGEIKG